MTQSALRRKDQFGWKRRRRNAAAPAARRHIARRPRIVLLGGGGTSEALAEAPADAERSLREVGLSSRQAAVLHRELLRRGVKGIKSAATVLQHPTVGGLARLVGGETMAMPAGELAEGLQLGESAELEEAVARLAGQVLERADGSFNLWSEEMHENKTV